MRNLLAAALAAAAFIGPQSSEARGRTVITLGMVSSVEVCQSRAEQMFSWQGSTLQVSRIGNHIAAYGLQGKDIDASVACVIAGNGQVAASLTMHTWSYDEEENTFRFEHAKRMRGYWENQ
ncbi:MAG: hypothetical protein AAGK00_11025 [Pseudomonadota bacterium]